MSCPIGDQHAIRRLILLHRDSVAELARSQQFARSAYGRPRRRREHCGLRRGVLRGATGATYDAGQSIATAAAARIARNVSGVARATRRTSREGGTS